VPFIVMAGIALALVLIGQDPPKAIFGLFCIYGLSGYVVYAYRKAKGRPTSVIATSTDDPEEAGLHR
jgi:CDP-diacylglycerol--serine O-phosphatidyltransferase